MTTKIAKAEMLEAREAAVNALDAKIGNMPEWKIFRAVDRALAALDETTPAEKSTPRIVRSRYRINGGGTAPYPSYMSLAEKALNEVGHPVPTNGMVSFIAKHRPLSGDPDSARNVIQSSLSKDERFVSVPWQGARAWWFTGKEVPK